MTVAELLEQGRKAYFGADFAAARAIWTPLAEAGSAEAQAWIGSLYANGDGVEVDDRLAFAWYLRAAEGGYAPAQNNVAAMCAAGRGTERDDAAAARWLAAAAEAGDSNAQFNLAVFHASGRAVEKDQERAIALYRQAATAGHRAAQGRLGGILADMASQSGENRKEAFMWLFLAAQHGVGSALNALDRLVRQMSAEEKSEALRLAEAWRRQTRQEPGMVPLNPLPA